MKKSIIRTSIKNENLLAKKMENLRVKKANQRKTSALKHRLDRSNKVDGVLQSKIEQSIARAKYVQGARKSGWEQINSSIDAASSGATEAKKTAKQIDREEEDAYVDQFFKDDAEETAEKEEPSVLFSSGNAFAALEETEA